MKTITNLEKELRAAEDKAAKLRKEISNQKKAEKEKQAAFKSSLLHHCGHEVGAEIICCWCKTKQKLIFEVKDNRLHGEFCPLEYSRDLRFQIWQEYECQAHTDACKTSGTYIQTQKIVVE